MGCSRVEYWLKQLQDVVLQPILRHVLEKESAMRLVLEHVRVHALVEQALGLALGPVQARVAALAVVLSPPGASACLVLQSPARCHQDVVQTQRDRPSLHPTLHTTFACPRSSPLQVNQRELVVVLGQ